MNTQNPNLCGQKEFILTLTRLRSVRTSSQSLVLLLLSRSFLMAKCYIFLFELVCSEELLIQITLFSLLPFLRLCLSACFKEEDGWITWVPEPRMGVLGSFPFLE